MFGFKVHFIPLNCLFVMIPFSSAIAEENLSIQAPLTPSLQIEQQPHQNSTPTPEKSEADKQEQDIKNWFSHKNCQGLEIKRTSPGPENSALQTMKIQDKSSVLKIITQIESINSNGTKLVEAHQKSELIDLHFLCESQTFVISILDKHIKTPAEKFHELTGETGARLYSDILSILNPKLNNNILKIIDQEITFEHFTLIYKGRINHDPQTLSMGNDEIYIIRDKMGNEQKVQVITRPKQPAHFEFKVNNESFTLLTFKNLNQEIIYPHYFQIIENKSPFIMLYE